MSNEINTMMENHTLVEYFGGFDKGLCIQVTTKDVKLRNDALEQMQEEGFIRLTIEDAAALCNDLSLYIKREALRRQDLLKKQIEKLKTDSKTVFHEIAELDEYAFESKKIVVSYISKFCPKF